jgi:hypothetical protein
MKASNTPNATWIPCKRCNGLGNIPCQTCGGKKTPGFICSKCGGSGKKDCPTCNGRGGQERV